MLKPVELLCVCRTKNKGNATSLQFGCNAEGQVAIQIDVKHHAIESRWTNSFFGGGDRACDPGNHSAKPFQHFLCRHGYERVILDDKDPRSQQVRFLIRGFNP